MALNSPCAAADSLGGSQGEGLTEDAKPREETLLRGRQQRVAPVQGGRDGSLPFGQIRDSARGNGFVEMGEQVGRRENLRAGGGQLQRQRQTIEPRLTTFCRVTDIGAPISSARFSSSRIAGEAAVASRSLVAHGSGTSKGRTTTSRSARIRRGALLVAKSTSPGHRSMSSYTAGAIARTSPGSHR